MAYTKIPYARILSSDPLNPNLPIGKIELAFDSTTQIGLSVYYFKSSGNKPLKVGTKLANVYLHPLRIPRTFKSVIISDMDNLTYESLSFDPDSDQSIGSIREGEVMKINEHDTEDINSLFMLGFEPYQFSLTALIDYSQKNPPKIANWNRYLKQLDQISKSNPNQILYTIDVLNDFLQIDFDSKVFENLFLGINIDSVPLETDIFPLVHRFPPGFISYSGTDGCPRFKAGKFLGNNSVRKAKTSKEDVNGNIVYSTVEIEQSNLINSFFKFNNHFFLPMTLPNGNSFYYAFENENIIRYWIYKENQAAIENKNFAIAANSPIYSENILGIEICKDIRIVEIGSPPTPFEQ